MSNTIPAPYAVAHHDAIRAAAVDAIASMGIDLTLGRAIAAIPYELGVTVEAFVFDNRAAWMPAPAPSVTELADAAALEMEAQSARYAIDAAARAAESAVYYASQHGHHERITSVGRAYTVAAEAASHLRAMADDAARYHDTMEAEREAMWARADEATIAEARATIKARRNAQIEAERKG